MTAKRLTDIRKCGELDLIAGDYHSKIASARVRLQYSQSAGSAVMPHISGLA